MEHHHDEWSEKYRTFATPKTENVPIKIIPNNKQFRFVFICASYVLVTFAAISKLSSTSRFDMNGMIPYTRNKKERTLALVLLFSDLKWIATAKEKKINKYKTAKVSANWHVYGTKYSFGSDIAYRCLIRWLGKRYEKPFAYLDFFFLVFFSFILKKKLLKI